MAKEFTEVYGNSQLFHRISREIGWYWKIDHYHELKSNLDWIYVQALEAENLQLRDDKKYARFWLMNLKRVAYDADDLFDDLSYERMRRRFEKNNMLLKVKDFFSSSNRLVYRTNMAYRFKDLSEKLKVLLDDYALFRKGNYYYNPTVISNNTQTPATSDVGDASDKIIGREKDISNLIELLIRPPSLSSNDSAAQCERENVSVVHIGGMAGIGKTKLAQAVYNDESVSKHFERRIWVTVPAVFDLKEVFKRMIRYVNHDAKFDAKCYDDDLTMRLQMMLKGKKYLLVLDDFWDARNPDIWKSLKLRLSTFGSHGSKILVTSRKINVAWSIPWMTNTYHLQELSTDECWSIIKENAFSSSRGRVLLENPETVKLGKDVARKCCGLPLAARMLAYILVIAEEWKLDLIMKASNMMDNEEFREKIYQTLKLSYDHLPSSALKQCFSYCSIFPRGRVIDRDEIIKLWMAEGFLVPKYERSSMEDTGNEYFDRLLNDSLFQSIENKDDELREIQKCKLNDFVYHLARTVAGDEDEYVPRMFPKVGNDKHRLRTFFATEVGDCDKIQKVFRNKNLRVLYLSGSTIQKVPASLSKLRHLRYLNLSGCQNLDVLDDQSVNSLYNLQTLVLRNCKSLSKLPEGIGSMRSLRHLDISHTNIKVLPTSVTSLQDLRTLDVFNCTNFEGLPENVGALENLRSLNLSHTGIKILPTSVTSLQNLRALDVSHCANLEGFPEDIGTLKDLGSLDISHTMVSRLPDSISGLKRLTTLRLHSCPNLEHLPKGIEALRWLKGLDITGTKVKVVPDKFLA